MNYFIDYGELSNLILQNSVKEVREEKEYGDDNQVDDKLYESSSLKRTLFFPKGREAGKVLASYPFQKPKTQIITFSNHLKVQLITS